MSEIKARAAALPEPIAVNETIRLVVHVQTTETAVDDLVSLMRNIAQEKKATGFVPATTNGLKPQSGY